MFSRFNCILILTDSNQTKSIRLLSLILSKTKRELEIFPRKVQILNICFTEEPCAEVCKCPFLNERHTLECPEVRRERAKLLVASITIRRKRNSWSSRFILVMDGRCQIR